LEEAQGRKLHSVFFGGGTPSLFSAAGIGRIISAAETVLGFEDNIEITLEANPGTFEQARFADYRQRGVNRLSIGVQSFNSDQLQNLGRIHSESEASLAVRQAQAVGFDNINIDLMHGLPNQLPAHALQDLQRALELRPTHISWYQLTIEKNTPFYSQPPSLPSSDVLAEIEERGFELLADNGFHRYEVSAFCRDKRMSQHNLNYWQFGDYLGIGAGAHGKITNLITGEIQRSQITRLPQHYLARKKINFDWKTVDKNQLPFEFMMNALRLSQGVPTGYFEQRTGLAFNAIENIQQRLIEKDLLVDEEEIIACTATGFRFLNDVVGEFLVKCEM
jgi:oxygen-independent coproporphyrinogen-3 oxidase